jgi:hypothetical protein
MAIKWFDLVADTASTTGTGTFTVSGTAPSGYRTFSTVLSVADEFVGRIKHQTANEWEVGIYTYSAANQFTRSGRILASSNAGSAVSFSAGGKDVALVLPANWGTRETLTAARTYYVRTDGDDANTGLVNSAGGAFETWQHAIDVVTGTLDFGGQDITIEAGAAGTWNVTGNNATIGGWVGGGTLRLRGDVTTPGNVIISCTSGHCFDTNGTLGGSVYIEGFDLRTITTGICIQHFGIGILFIGKMIYGACASYHIQIYGIGRYAECYAAYTINGSAGRHVSCGSLCYYYLGGVTVTITGALTFTTFINVFDNCFVEGANTWNIGTSVTGTRFNVTNGSVLNTYGGGASHFPGDSAGTGTNFGASPWGLYL